MRETAEKFVADWGSALTLTPGVAHGAPKLQGAECRRSRILVWVRFVFSRVLLHALAQASLVLSAFATCTAPKNAIEAENCLADTPSSQWYVDGAGSPKIQGFASDISVNAGQIIFFKIHECCLLSYRHLTCPLAPRTGSYDTKIS